MVKGIFKLAKKALIGIGVLVCVIGKTKAVAILIFVNNMLTNKAVATFIF